MVILSNGVVVVPMPGPPRPSYFLSPPMAVIVPPAIVIVPKLPLRVPKLPAILDTPMPGPPSPPWATTVPPSMMISPITEPVSPPIPGASKNLPRTFTLLEPPIWIFSTVLERPAPDQIAPMVPSKSISAQPVMVIDFTVATPLASFVPITLWKGFLPSSLFLILPPAIVMLVASI